MTCCRWMIVCSLALTSALAQAASEGNRLAYLDEGANPYYVGRGFPRLVTPQWVGEPGVEAVVILAIDDLRKPAVHEAFLRPILDRLRQHTGRAPVSQMTNHIEPNAPLLQKWLAEGLSIEAHTLDHPCPPLQKGDLAAAKRTYDAGVDLVAAIPGNQPVAFRMPCCDSMNDVGPRFYQEIFNRTTPQGRFLQADSSVFMLFTPADPALPRDLALDAKGAERFRKYLPVDKGFCNYVEDYPYPFVIGGTCWELPAVVPSDWEAFHRHGAKNPITVADWNAAIDATVAKQGVFTLCFHPHGWIGNEQIVELIDRAVARHGSKVAFLTLRDACERLNRNLLAGQRLRSADGLATGARLLDVNADGYLDAVVGTPEGWKTRVWQPGSGTWAECAFPVPGDGGVRFGVLQGSGRASALVRSESAAGLWHFDGEAWQPEADGLAGLELDGPVFTARNGRDEGVRLRDLDGDGRCELLVGNDRQNGVFTRAGDTGPWNRLNYALPEGAAVVDAQGRDAGLRLVDLNGDALLDVVFSDARHWGVGCFQPGSGWTSAVRQGPAGRPGALPMIVRADGTDNGVWFSQGALWVQNEETGKAMPNEVIHLPFSEILQPGSSQPLPAVTGTVTLDGRPVAGAEVLFVPQSETPSAKGTTDKRGAFIMGTHAAGDGVTPGTYRIVIQPGGAANQAASPQIPAQFTTPNASPIRADVRPGTNEINLELPSH